MLRRCCLLTGPLPGKHSAAMPAMGLAGEDDEGDQDKGLLVYQEAKEFDGEWHVVSVYDNIDRRVVSIEAYGLDTMDMLTIFFPYNDFDAFFRFNAELMNPNRKDGRFHWIIERLQFISDGIGGRKLNLAEQPTTEVPQLPIYETERKIPTGRMDLKERQRLREEMDMLNIKRDENIAKKRAKAKARFLAWLAKMKAEDEARKRLVDEKIEQEKSMRFELKEEMAAREAERSKAERAKQQQRVYHAEVKEERTEESEEEELRTLRLRWKANDAEKARVIAEARARKQQLAEEEVMTKEAAKERAIEVAARREVAFEARLDRARQVAALDLARVDEQQAEILRDQEFKEHKKKTFVRELHVDRQPFFQDQHLKTQARLAVMEREKEEIRMEEERRAMPVKVKTKGKAIQLAGHRDHESSHDDFMEGLESADELHDACPKDLGDALDRPPSPERPPTADGEQKEAKEGKKEAKKEGKKDGHKAKPKSKRKAGAKAKDKVKEDDTNAAGRVIDAVEEKMRAEMAEQQRREDLEVIRKHNADDRDVQRARAEALKAKGAREGLRQKDDKQRREQEARRLVQKERQDEQRRATEQKVLEYVRLQKVREENIARKEQLRAAGI